MERDLFVDFAGEIDVRCAAFGAGLNRHAADVRFDFGDFDPDGAGIDLRGDDVVDGVIGNQRAVTFKNFGGGSNDLGNRTLITTFDFIFHKWHTHFHVAVHGADTTGQQN